jgi:hypothetical protein
MTTPPPSPRQETVWWTRPSVVLPIVATIAIVVALLTPQAVAGRFGDSRLSSHLAGSLGARLFSDMAHRLGWRVVQRDSQPVPTVVTGRTIHAVLAPVIPITSSEAHDYLQAVRNGDGLLFVLGTRNPLSDSLGVTHFARGNYLSTNRSASVGCAKRMDFTPPLWPDGRVHLWGVRWLRDAPADRRGFAPLAKEDEKIDPPGDAQAASGFALGKGRVVIVSDPDLLRNDVLRRCAWGADLIAVGMLEWLRDGGPAPRTTLDFDEYHQGYAARPTVIGVSAAFLVEHPVGRTILQLAFAALILLFAISPRAITPQDAERVERRDPLEQVDALAHAYEQVHATRTVTARLLHGLRWRVERGASDRARADEAFLDAAVARAPQLRADADVVRRALAEPVNDSDLPKVGAALQTIEHTLTTSPS